MRQQQQGTICEEIELAYDFICRPRHVRNNPSRNQNIDCSRPCRQTCFYISQIREVRDRSSFHFCFHFDTTLTVYLPSFFDNFQSPSLPLSSPSKSRSRSEKANPSNPPSVASSARSTNLDTSWNCATSVTSRTRKTVRRGRLCRLGTGRDWKGCRRGGCNSNALNWLVYWIFNCRVDQVTRYYLIYICQLFQLSRKRSHVGRL